MTAEPAIARNEYIDRPTAQRETIGNEGSQVDEACAKLDGAIDCLSQQWEALAVCLAPVRMAEAESASLLQDVSPEPVRSRVASFVTSRATQVADLAETISRCKDMIDL